MSSAAPIPQRTCPARRARDEARLPGPALHPVVEAAWDFEGGTRRFSFAEGVTIEVGPEMVGVLQR